jgi:hypothetical protein
MKLKRFEEINEAAGDISKIKFVAQKAKVLDKIDELMEVYDKFTTMVSPKHWRTTGTHFTELRGMKENVKEFTEATEKDKENPHFKKMLEDYTKKKKD